MTLALGLALLAACNTGAPVCENTCRWAYDGECDDGRPGAETDFCGLGTDCGDCGPNGGGSTRVPPYESPVRGFSADGDGPPTMIMVGVTEEECLDPEWSCGNEATLYRRSWRPDGTPGRGSCWQSFWYCPGVDMLDGNHGSRCQDGPYGVGCYPVSRPICRQHYACCPCGVYSGDVCTCPGEAVQICTELMDFMRPVPHSPAFDPFDVSHCRGFFRSSRGECDCGACLSGCDECIGVDLCGPAPVDAGMDVSAACLEAIAMQLESLRSIYTGSACIDACLDDFDRCMRQSNCTNTSSCQSGTTSCLTRCAP